MSQSLWFTPVREFSYTLALPTLDGPIHERKSMEPLAWLGVLAVIIGIVGVIVLLKGRKKPR